MTKYRIHLQPAERQELLSKVQKGRTAAKTIQKAYIRNQKSARKAQRLTNFYFDFFDNNDAF